jgi:hypothetical protein
VPTKYSPYRKRRKCGDACKYPRGKHRHELYCNQCGGSVGQLNQETQRTRFLFLAEHPDRHKGKEQRDSDIGRPESGYQDAVQWRQAARKHR